MPENSNDPIGSINISSVNNTSDSSREPEVAIAQAPFNDRSSEAKVFQKNPEDSRPKGSGYRKLPSRSSAKLKWLLSSWLFFFLTYCLVGFAAIPYALQTVLPEMLGEKINRPITVGSVRFNPFTLEIDLSNAIIGPNLSHPEDQVDPLFSVGSIKANLSWSSLIQSRMNFSQLQVDAFFLHMVRSKDNTYNIGDIIPTSSYKGIPLPDLPFPYLINNISLTNSRIFFDDFPSGKMHKIEQISLALPLLFQNNGTKIDPKINAGQAEYINPQFSAVVNNSPIEITGTTSTAGDTFTTRLKLHLEKIDLPAYFAYLPDKPNIILDKGTADIIMDMSLVSAPEKDLVLEIETVGHLSEVTLRDRYNYLSTLPTTTVTGTFLPLSSSFHFKEISLEEPELHFGKLPEGNWSLLAWDSKYPQKTKKASAHISIKKLSVNNGKFIFIDQHIDGGFSETAKDITLVITADNDDNKANNHFFFSGTTVGGSTISSQGDLSLSPFNISGKATLQHLDLKPFSTYLTLQNDIRIKEGKASEITSDFSFAFNEKNELTLTDTVAQLNNFTLSSQDRDWLIMPRVHISSENFVPGNRFIKGIKIAADTPEIHLKWDKHNDFQGIAPIQITHPQSTAQTKWDIFLSSLSFSNAVLYIEDQSLVHPTRFTVTKAAISLQDISTAPDNKGKFSASTDDFAGATLQLNGNLTLSPFSASLSTQLTDYPLTAISKHFSHWPTPDITGTVLAKGTITLPEFAFKGYSEINDFAAAQSGENLVRCKKAEAHINILTLSPLTLTVSLLDLTAPELNWVIPVQGPAAFTQLFRHNDLEHAVQKSNLTISQATLSDATLHFTDQRLSPHYATKIKFQGAMSNLLSQSGNRTKIDFLTSGDSDINGTIAGEIGLYDTPLFTDLAASFTDQNITNFSPYLESLLGYRINTGMFSFSTQFHQEQGKVMSRNSFSVSDFHLGKPLERPTLLPLTIALLSKEKGALHLSLPVNGTTSDPSYSFAGSIGRVLRNLVLKTTVSPFSHLVDSFPEIENIPHYLLFVSGSAALSEQSKKSLTLLGEILQQRPLLTLSIKGFASLGGDKEILLAKKQEKTHEIELRLEQEKSKKLSQTYGSEEIAPSISAIEKPLLQQKIPEAKVSKSELLQLARKREEAAITFLETELAIASSRLLQDTSGSLVADNAPGREGNRADFTFGVLKDNK